MANQQANKILDCDEKEVSILLYLERIKRVQENS